MLAYKDFSSYNCCIFLHVGVQALVFLTVVFFFFLIRTLAVCTSHIINLLFSKFVTYIHESELKCANAYAHRGSTDHNAYR